MQEHSSKEATNDAARPSKIDRELLDDEVITDFGGLMNKFLKEKAKDV